MNRRMGRGGRRHSEGGDSGIAAAAGVWGLVGAGAFPAAQAPALVAPAAAAAAASALPFHPILLGWFCLWVGVRGVHAHHMQFEQFDSTRLD